MHMALICAIMDITITTQEKERVQFSPIIASADSPIAVPGAKGVEASLNVGALRLYEIDCPGFKIWYNNYHISRRTYLYLSVKSPLLAFHSTINNTLHCKLEGLHEVTLLQGQFNVSCGPSINTVAWFDANQVYTTFSIHFEQDYLRKFATHFPLLDALLKKAEGGLPGMMSRYHGQMTPEMNALVKRILRCNYEGDIRNLYLDAKVQELLVLALEQTDSAEEKTADIVLRPYDIEKIREAHDYLLRNMENPCTLIELSHKVGINDFKLKKGFKKLYGTTVYDFLIDARMEKAKVLLLETDTSVHDIAFITGYKNLSSFITAFKKKMGYSPGSFKKMRKL
jgi:AraC family transcriptional regulator, transcriptional activator of the genes for pyochelin and ferripyochelin receptors